MEFDVFRTKNLFEMTRYDFREEIIQFPSDDPVDRYYIYKAIGIAETDNDLTYQDQISGEYKVLVEKGEADRSELLKDIYQHIWKTEYLDVCTRNGTEFSGDTMNSIFTTFTKWLSAVQAIKGPGQWSNRKVLQRYIDKNEKNESILYAAVKEDKDRVLSFFKSSYTLGNFIPAPAVFQKRGFSPSKDYWDLALASIYNYYQLRDKSVREDTVCTFIRPEPYSLEWLLRAEKNAENCKPWLDRFKTWDNFVEQNFMQPFLKVDKPVNGHYGPPDELWKGHFDCGGIPQGEDEFQQFFTNATQRILARGEMIAKKVKETIESA